MALELPCLPTKLWVQCIIPLLQTPGSSYKKLEELELIIRIGDKRQTTQCSDLLEGNEIKWVRDIIWCVYHPKRIEIRLSEYFDFGGCFGDFFENFCRKEHEIDLFTELDKIKSS